MDFSNSEIDALCELILIVDLKPSFEVCGFLWLDVFGDITLCEFLLL